MITEVEYLIHKQKELFLRVDEFLAKQQTAFENLETRLFTESSISVAPKQ